MKKLLVGIVAVMLVLSSVAAYAACGGDCKKSCSQKSEKKEGCPKADPNSK
jgi:hypothetical protein